MAANDARFSKAAHAWALVAALAFLLGADAAWAVNKCTGADGKVVFQDAPCMGQGEVINVRPASGHARAPIPAAPTASAPTQPTAAAPVAPPATAPAPAPTAPTKSALETQADQCLAWYKPLLRDPASAYYSEPAYEDKRVLRMTLHAKNGYGGVVVRLAACDFDQVRGTIDNDWTKIQAQRLGWYTK